MSATDRCVGRMASGGVNSLIPLVGMLALLGSALVGGVFSEFSLYSFAATTIAAS